MDAVQTIQRLNRAMTPIPVVHMTGLYVALCHSCSNILQLDDFLVEVQKTVKEAIELLHRMANCNTTN